MKKSELRIIKGAHIRWNKSADTNLFDVYEKPSRNKWNAFEHCKNLMHELRGRDLRIIAHNSMVFSVGFEYPHPETGELSFAYITRDYNRFAKVADLENID